MKKTGESKDGFKKPHTFFKTVVVFINLIILYNILRGRQCEIEKEYFLSSFCF